MQDLSHDFDVLAERADDCGAMWAARTLRKLATLKMEPPREWPGSMDEARRLVDTFAARAGFPDRERLAAILQYAAEWTWTESCDPRPRMAFARAG
ncbi:MAG TPA: hypothetical protein VJT73_12785 [Polyangiaceae bacterium]|nr:hypothetical protein [Polyangiaceae bacterium]